jgi:hypothetical protein
MIGSSCVQNNTHGKNGDHTSEDNDLFIESFFFTINATAIRLTIHPHLPGNLDALIPAAAEIIIVEMDSKLKPQSLANLPDEIMFLISAVEQRGRKGVIIFFFCLQGGEF